MAVTSPGLLQILLPLAQRQVRGCKAFLKVGMRGLGTPDVLGGALEGPAPSRISDVGDLWDLWVRREGGAKTRKNR